jgi:hypothetical protein
MLKILLASLCLFFSSPIWPFKCYITFAKDSCWTQYDVTIDVIDVDTAKVLTTAEMPVNTAWTRESFNCEASQKLKYQAQFKPTIWKGSEDKKYFSSNLLVLPEAMKPKEKAWAISVCFPKDFAEVPMPPTATSNCACDFSSIPALKPE